MSTEPWPPPDPSSGVIVPALRYDGVITGVTGIPIRCVIGGKPYRPDEPWLIWPGWPGAAPKEPQA